MVTCDRYYRKHLVTSSRDVIQSDRKQQRNTEVTEYKGFREVFTVKFNFNFVVERYRGDFGRLLGLFCLASLKKVAGWGGGE